MGATRPTHNAGLCSLALSMRACYSCVVTQARKSPKSIKEEPARLDVEEAGAPTTQGSVTVGFPSHEDDVTDNEDKHDFPDQGKSHYI